MALELEQSEEPQKIVEISKPVATVSASFDINSLDGRLNPDHVTLNQEVETSFEKQVELDKMFPDVNHLEQYKYVFDQAVDPSEKALYTKTLLKYAESEPEDRKTLGVTTRLEHFEKSSEYSESQLKVKLSDALKKLQAVEFSNNERELRELSRPGGPEAPNGLSRGEGDAANNALANASKAAQNLGNAGSNFIGAVSGMANGLVKTAAAPFVAVKDAGVGKYHKVKGDGIPRQEKVTEEAIQLGIKNLAETVEKTNKLPSDAPASVVSQLLEKAQQQQKELSDQIRAQGRQGVNNSLDETLTDAQRRQIKTPDEVLESGKTSSEKVASLMDKLAQSPALEGEGKEQLKEKAKVMAIEAAEMIRKMIETIRNMFTQGNKAKAEGAEAASPSAAQAPRM